jgi:cephalosporin hydroxylase
MYDLDRARGRAHWRAARMPKLNLSEAARAASIAMQARVSRQQGGVPTFFDNFLDQLLRRLAATQEMHGWDPHRPVPPGSEAAQRVTELRWLDGFLSSLERGRFVPYAERRQDERAGRASDIGGRELIMSQGTTACMTWKGGPLFKTAFDFALLPMLLWELRPATVLEIGSGTGASARWLADMMRALGVDGKVYSVDIKPVVEPYPWVHFLAGDCRSPATLFDPDLLRHAPHPWLAIEDAHVNVHDVLVHLGGFLGAGDYLIVEDSGVKREDLDRFLAPRADGYRVDTRYTDFFGRNATCAANSIFVKL